MDVDETMLGNPPTIILYPGKSEISFVYFNWKIKVSMSIFMIDVRAFFYGVSDVSYTLFVL